jgi:polar amino acid transport system substrate-binding protein
MHPLRCPRFSPLHSILAIVLAVIGLGGAPAQAGDAVPRHLVCHDDTYIPYFMQEGDRFAGVDADLLREAAKRLGIALEFRMMPFRRILSELDRKADSSVDCAFALSRTPAREQILEFGNEALESTEYTLFVRDEANGIGSLADLMGKTIGVRAGFRLPESIAKGVERQQWRIAEIGTDAGNFQKLSIHRVDAVLADKLIGMYTMQQLKLGKVRLIEPPVLAFHTYLVFKKSANSHALAAAFDRALAEMRRDGTFERIRAVYGQAPAR